MKRILDYILDYINLEVLSYIAALICALFGKFQEATFLMATAIYLNLNQFDND